MRNVVLYSLLRIALWLVLWYVLVLVGLGVMIAGVLSVLIAMMVSFLLLGGVRTRAAEDLQGIDERRRARRGPRPDEDAEAEDALFEDEDKGADEDKVAEEDEDASEGADEGAGRRD